MTKQLDKAVRKLAKTADTKALSEALGKLVNARLAPKPRPVTAPNSLPRQAGWTPVVPTVPTTPRSRRTAPRRGIAKAYTALKLNDARLGTWRHYMLKVILAHSNTRDAEAEHAQCDNPKFADNRLDFNWAANNGYITKALIVGRRRWGDQ